jgi:hypothetical protein
MPAYRSFQRSTTGFAVTIVITALSVSLPGVFARESGDPIQLQWTEGDVAGMTAIWSPDATKVIGFVEYHQHRQGDRLEAARVARFADGSSDEDQVEARVSGTLEALRGLGDAQPRAGEHGAPSGCAPRCQAAARG